MVHIATFIEVGIFVLFFCEFKTAWNEHLATALKTSDYALYFCVNIYGNIASEFWCLFGTNQRVLLFLIQDASKRARGLKDILTCTLYILVSCIQISWQNIVGSFLCSHLGWTEVYSCLQMLFAYKCTLKCHSSIFILLYYHFMIKSANTGCFYCCCFFLIWKTSLL